MADTIPKLAIALLINKVLAPSRPVRYFLAGIATLLNCFSIVVVIMSFVSSNVTYVNEVLMEAQVQCQPIKHQWERETVSGSCWSPLIFAYFSIGVGVYATILDLIFCLYPLLVISRLNMRLRKKITVMFVFGLGLFILCATLYKTAAPIPKLRYEQVDFSWVIGEVILWTIVESNVVIIAGSVPTWGWVFRTQLFEKIVSWITLHSRGTLRATTRLSSQEDNADKRSDEIELSSDHDNSQRKESKSVALKSIDEIERAAFS